MRHPVRATVTWLTEWWRQRAIGYIQAERRELENVFALLVLGSFVGLP
ncbi:hypothetical protein [Geochorda subterranea]|uniref:DDE family transposase n=1 Tax=Geochorda subterranea TaxID=3109564 RepID=A0ABZ1BM90_9FIRM|nr:hypothetical protein [Limnochorda sp. LNt]WRP13877.1 hypothetical protein VLY81_10595 [Limnochorda sp. LNt]